MALPFTSSPAMTLGVELELQLVDRASRDLSPVAPRLLERLGGATQRIKPEFFQSMIEVTSGICAHAGEVRRDLERSIAQVRAACDELGVDVAAAGSHPFARHRDRLLFPDERYQALIDRNRWVARRFQIFGIHIHVGMRDSAHAVAMINGMLPYIPHAVALSASSPFWQGSDTGLASSRLTVYESLPTAGLPCTFADWAEFETLYQGMVASGAIRTLRDIWWDIRPHPDFGTVELRVCDMIPTLSEITSVAALVHCLFGWLDARYRSGERFEPQAYWILRENKWRALRWGLEAEVIIDAHGRTRLLRDDAVELIGRLESTAVALGCERELAGAAAIIRALPSYERQRAVFTSTGSLEKVVEALVREFATDAVV